MKTYTITKKDLDKKNRYIGSLNLYNLDGNLEADENLGCVFVDSINAKGHIYFKSGSGIEAGCGIEAGRGIEAGFGIKAGRGIEAGCGIEAGLSISCQSVLSFEYRLFAGIAIWKLDVTDEEKTVTCGKLEKGTIAYGILKETGLESEKNVSKYKATELRKKADELLSQAKELEESL